MASDQLTVEDQLELEGQLVWRSFLARHTIAVVLLVTSVAVPFLTIQAGPAKTLIADAFALLVGTASLLHLMIWLAALVTRFRLTENSFTFSRFSRRSRSVRTSDVVAVHEHSAANAGATIWLQDGTTLAIQYEDLPNSRDLVTVLRNVCPTDVPVEGCLNPSQIARTLVFQWVASCLLLAISVFGVMCLAVFFQPKNLRAAPLVFLLLGLTLLSLAAAGFYASVLRFWVGSVRWFEWDGTVLRYRTVFSASLRERDVAEIDAVSARRPNSPQGEHGSWRVIRFRDGERLKLQVGTLHNAERLFSAIKAIVELRPAGIAAEPMRPVGLRHPLWPAIEPHLAEGESVVWLGQPIYGKLWSEMSAEVVFGLIPGAFGAGMLFLAYQFGVRQGNFDVWPLLIGGLFFGGIGAWVCAAPWRYRKMLQHTVYAVTTSRAVILNGLLWGSQSAVQPSGVEIESLTPEQVRLFEVVRRRRDILLGGQWKRGRKGSRRWVHSGFLAADDPEGAENAIRFLLRTCPAV